MGHGIFLDRINRNEGIVLSLFLILRRPHHVHPVILSDILLSCVFRGIRLDPCLIQKNFMVIPP